MTRGDLIGVFVLVASALPIAGLAVFAEKISLDAFSEGLQSDFNKPVGGFSLHSSYSASDNVKLEILPQGTIRRVIERTGPSFANVKASAEPGLCGLFNACFYDTTRGSSVVRWESDLTPAQKVTRQRMLDVYSAAVSRLPSERKHQFSVLCEKLVGNTQLACKIFVA